MRRFRGRLEELYSDANFLTDAIELRSNSITSILAPGISFSIASLTLLPLSVFLTAIITCTPRKARTRVVSTPIPLDAPKVCTKRKNRDAQIAQFQIYIYSNHIIVYNPCTKCAIRMPKNESKRLQQLKRTMQFKRKYETGKVQKVKRSTHLSFHHAWKIKYSHKKPEKNI